ncbi:hypothetical protein M758_UG040600 [Ceratodon purpureus]|nr:hypothetical protein M758_UG040600 [Ceratodon purpureus]
MDDTLKQHLRIKLSRSTCFFSYPSRSSFSLWYKPLPKPLPYGINLHQNPILPPLRHRHFQLPSRPTRVNKKPRKEERRRLQTCYFWTFIDVRKGLKLRASPVSCKPVSL